MEELTGAGARRKMTRTTSNGLVRTARYSESNHSSRLSPSVLCRLLILASVLASFRSSALSDKFDHSSVRQLTLFIPPPLLPLHPPSHLYKRSIIATKGKSKYMLVRASCDSFQSTFSTSLLAARKSPLSPFHSSFRQWRVWYW